MSNLRLSSWLLWWARITFSSSGRPNRSISRDKTKRAGAISSILCYLFTSKLLYSRQSPGSIRATSQVSEVDQAGVVQTSSSTTTPQHTTITRPSNVYLPRSRQSLYRPNRLASPQCLHLGTKIRQVFHTQMTLNHKFTPWSRGMAYLPPHRSPIILHRASNIIKLRLEWVKLHYHRGW